MRNAIVLLVLSVGLGAVGLDQLLGQDAKPPMGVPVFAAAGGYGGEAFVVERSITRNVMKADGTGYRERLLRLKVQSEAALREVSVVTLPFASASEKVEIEYVRVYRADGTVVETPLTDAMEQPEPVTREAPFYSDLKDKQLPVKSLRVGDTLEWKARIVRTKAEAPGQFWGQETFTTNAVSLEEVLELRVPKGTYVKVWTNPKVKGAPVETDDGAEHVYRWEEKNLTPTVGAAAEAEKAAKKTRVLTAEEEQEQRAGQLPSVEWSTYKSWADVGAWYRGLETGRMVPDEAVLAKVKEVTAGKTTEEEKVRAVYGFVAPQIRYIGVAFGVGRYQPHHAEEVLDNQYGDCKDKHTLLAAMLTALGLKPDAVLIGQGIRFNEAVPSPAAFNHLITRVDVGGKAVWLDATAEVAPYRMLAYDLRDKQALVVPEQGAARVERTPKDAPFAQFQDMKAVGTIDEKGVSNSHLTFTLRGDAELLYREVIRQISPAQYGEFVQRMANAIGYAGTATNPALGKPEDTDGPLVFSFDYKRDRGDDWVNKRIVAQLQPVGLVLLDEKEPPVAATDLGSVRTETSASEMKLPAGWTAELPEAVHEKSAWATYDETYRFANGTVYGTRKVDVLLERVPVADWKSYKKFTDAIHLGSEMYVVLQRPGGETDKPGKQKGGKASNEAAAKAVQEAATALDARDVNAATQALARAREANATEKGLWGETGMLAVQRGEMTEAVRDFQKELALHPDSTWVYGPMSMMQMALGKRDDGEVSMRKFVEANPDNKQARLTLMEALIADEKAPQAVDVGDQYLDGLAKDDAGRNDPAFLAEFGKAQLQAGMAGGAVTLVGMIKDTEDSLLLNNAAYELADANREIPAAEGAVRKSLAKLGAESQTWTLDENLATLRSKSGLIVSAWDTLGWVLYREGKLAEAKDYVQAAWMNRPSLVVGEHLGDIAAAEGDHNEALHWYGLALASVPALDENGRRREEGSPAKRVKRKMEEQKKAGGKADTKNALEEVGKVRRIPLGSVSGRTGIMAEYRVLLEHGKVVGTKAVGEETSAAALALVTGKSFTHLEPNASDARLVKIMTAFCAQESCELGLQP